MPSTTKLNTVTAPQNLAWNVSWNGAVCNPGTAGAVRAKMSVIGAASAHGARGRASCKWQDRRFESDHRLNIQGCYLVRVSAVFLVTLDTP